MKPGGTYFYSFRQLADVSDKPRQELGAVAELWTWASVGGTSTNVE
jgi:hypothetical protein